MSGRILPIFPAASVTSFVARRDSTAFLQLEMTSTTAQIVYPALRVPVLPPSHKGKRKRGVIPIRAHKIARLVPP